MPAPATPSPSALEPDLGPFVSNAPQLTLRQWLLVLAVALTVMLGLPRLWPRVERFDTPADYRLPYALSEDYWLYEQRLNRLTAEQIPIIGDSVIWGEYVLRDGTLSHFLNAAVGAPDRFVNAGVNGMFPLALEGLIRHYGGALRHRKVILHGNLLWMSSPEADLSTPKERPFNHARLVPQFYPRLPCYRADGNARLSRIIGRSSDFLSWVKHLQNAYFGQQNFLAWTLADDGKYPPHYPNAWRNPLRQITLRVPGEPRPDPERGPASPRHRPWSKDGGPGTQRFNWVPLERSLQWGAFQRLVRCLRERGNDVLVIVGPFNQHLMAPGNRPLFQKERAQMLAWLREQNVPVVAPSLLPSNLYADASHPLTEGYHQLAGEIGDDAAFQAWLRRE